MSEMSYLQFENQMRGSRELISERLKAYTPLILALRQQQGDSSCALDIGSGRGEWLELLSEHGWNASGVDSDQDMIDLCRERGLAVTHADGKTFLDQLPPASIDLISAFHVVEHIPVAELYLFVYNCLQALKPNGILLLETPNPQNLLVGSSEFYIDPTHTRAVPPSLLSFIATDAGFGNSRILFLNGQNDIDQSLPQLADVIYGVGYDYALIAQKTNQTWSPVDEAMRETYERLDSGALPRRIAHFDNVMRGMRDFQNNLTAKVAELEQQVATLNERLTTLTLRHMLKQSVVHLLRRVRRRILR